MPDYEVIHEWRDAPSDLRKAEKNARIWEKWTRDADERVEGLLNWRSYRGW